MKFALLIYGSDQEWAEMSDEDRRAAYQRINDWWEREAKAGRIVGGEELAPKWTAKTLRRTGDRQVVTDGPFVEAKETIGGFGILQVPDEAAALEMLRDCPFRAIELRPIVGAEQRP